MGVLREALTQSGESAQERRVRVNHVYPLGVDSYSSRGVTRQCRWVVWSSLTG